MTCVVDFAEQPKVSRETPFWWFYDGLSYKSTKYLATSQDFHKLFTILSKYVSVITSTHNPTIFWKHTEICFSVVLMLWCEVKIFFLCYVRFFEENEWLSKWVWATLTQSHWTIYLLLPMYTHGYLSLLLLLFLGL